MLPVYICEDMPERLDILTKIIEKQIKEHGLDMEIVCPALCADVVVDYLCKNPHNALYFLDLDLKSDVDGFDLASKIRTYDPRAFIVIVTTHAELSLMAFERQIEAMDYIVKEDVENFEARVLSCCKKALKLYNARAEKLETVTITVGKSVQVFCVDDIFYAETAGRRRIRLYYRNGAADMVYTLEELVRQTLGSFYRCHKSCVVNLKHISKLDIKKHAAVMSNGGLCRVSRTEITRMKALLGGNRI